MHRNCELTNLFAVFFIGFSILFFEILLRFKGECSRPFHSVQIEFAHGILENAFLLLILQGARQTFLRNFSQLRLNDLMLANSLRIQSLDHHLMLHSQISKCLKLFVYFYRQLLGQLGNLTGQIFAFFEGQLLLYSLIQSSGRVRVKVILVKFSLTLTVQDVKCLFVGHSLQQNLSHLNFVG